MLSTPDFYENFVSKDFQDKWVLDANDFFVKKLGLSDNTIVRFIALEVNLIKKLHKMAEEIHPDSVDSALAQMTQLEEAKVKEMKIILEGENRFEKFKDFRKNFYTDYREKNLKSPASVNSSGGTDVSGDN